MTGGNQVGKGVKLRDRLTKAQHALSGGGKGEKMGGMCSRSGSVAIFRLAPPDETRLLSRAVSVVATRRVGSSIFPRSPLSPRCTSKQTNKGASSWRRPAKGDIKRYN